MLTDTHCHLDQVEDPEAAIAQACAAGVGRIVAVSEGPETIDRVMALARSHPGVVLAGIGLHPVPLASLSDEEADRALAAVERLLPEADVLGEVGLDHKVAVTPEEKARQRTFLDRLFALAAAARKPANLHSRRAERAALEAATLFHRQTGLGAQMHWFTHSAKLVRIANEAGIYVSVGPSAIGSAEVARVVLAIAPELLLLETDTPVPIGRVPNSPARAAEVAREVARIKGWSLDELERRTEENFARFLFAKNVAWE